jgi:hypothetical protein
MKNAVKALAPNALAFAAASAQAGTPEIDYGFPQANTTYSETGAAASASSATWGRSDVEPFLIQRGQGAVEVNPAFRQNYTPRSRDEVRNEAAQQPRRFAPDYFA